jgi:hypothetical protein
MIDIFNLPDKAINKQVFWVNSSGSTGWETWSKPNNVSFVYILCIGGGAGGGGGRGNSNNSGGGGGGGGSSAFSTGLFPASLLPDTLFVSVGKGGIGGNGGAQNVNGVIGGSGELSYVSVTPSISTTSVLMVNGAAVPTGGGGGTSSLQGAAGLAGTIWNYSTSFIFPQLGQITPTAGQNGVAGGTAAGNVGASITITLPVSGGAGGGGNSSGGATANGGNITGVSILPTIVGGTANSTTVIEGNHGIGDNLPTPLFFTGGSGGGSSSTAARVGGFGGDAGIGSGGGGGGSAQNAAGGGGGNGGNGIIIITCW